MVVQLGGSLLVIPLIVVLVLSGFSGRAAFSVSFPDGSFFSSSPFLGGRCSCDGIGRFSSGFTVIATVDFS